MQCRTVTLMLLLWCLGAGYTYPSIAQTPSFDTLPLTENATQTQKLLANDRRDAALFGHSVAIDGNVAIIGAPFDGQGSSLPGAAYIFIYNGETWIQQAKLVANDASNQARFGWDVAISGGNTVIVSATSDNSIGAAYIFVRNDLTFTWSQQAKLVPSDANVNDEFGYSVALVDNTALIGSRGHDSIGLNNHGAAYVFVRNGSTWAQQAKLLADDREGGEGFGFSVALDNHTALIGAWLADIGDEPNAGAGYAFVRNGSTWTQQAKLVDINAEYQEYLGISVALADNYAFLGAEGSSNEITGAGDVHVFMRDGTVWVYDQRLTASVPSEENRFGWSLAVDGDTLVVGSRNNNTDPHTRNGRTYLFTKNLATQAWVEVETFIATDYSTDDFFAASLALANGKLLVGAYGEDTSPNDENGAVYAFSLETTTPPPAVTLLSPTGHIPNPQPTFSWTESASATWYHVWLFEANGTSAGYWAETGNGITCAAGICQRPSPTTLASYGLHQWWVQHYGAAYGYAAWSAAGYFVFSKVPSAPTPNAPNGNIADNTPNFNWNHAEAAEWYYVWLSSQNATLMDQWYNAFTICNFDTTVCTVNAATHGLTLPNGGYTWWLQAWSPIGYSAWSAGQSFTVSASPVAAPEVAPVIEVVPVLPAVEVEPLQIELP